MKDYVLISKDKNRRRGLIDDYVKAQYGLIDYVLPGFENLSGQNNNGSVADGNQDNGSSLLGSGIASALGPAGLVVNTFANLLQAGRQNKALRKERAKQAMLDTQQQNSFNEATYASYDEKGTKGPSFFYKMGGVRPLYKNGGIQGGVVEQLSSTTNKAHGRSHEDGGIDMPGLEVEGGEVNHNDQEKGVQIWFSNDLKASNGKAFSEVAETLGRKGGNEETRAAQLTGIAKNTALANAKNYQGKLRLLAQEQFVEQLKNGISPFGENKKAASGAILDTLRGAVPYIDNFVNMILTGNTPEVPDPRLEKPIGMDTTFDVNPQLAEIRAAQSSGNRALVSTTSSAPAARANVIANTLQTVATTNELLGQKENAETQLKNADAANRQNVYNRNQQILAQNDFAKFQRANEIQGRISGNVADFVENAEQQGYDRKLRERDAATIELLKERFKADGIWDRTVSATFEKFIKGEIDYEEFNRQINTKNTGKTGSKNRPALINQNVKPKEDVNLLNLKFY